MAQYASSAAQLSPILPVSANHHSLASSISGGAGPNSGRQPSLPPPNEGAANGTDGAQHKRVYQACIPCRRRKVRCDLGSVDNPHEPPCVRCRRESKQCYFSATRRKRKADDGSLVDDIEVDADDYVQRNGRKQVRTSETSSVNGIDRRLFNDAPLTPGGSRGRTQPLKRPGDGYGSAEKHGEFGGAEPNTPLENFEARTVMRREVYGPHDALDLLYKAATDNSPARRHEEHRASVASTTKPQPLSTRPESISRHSSHNRDADLHPHQTAQEQGRAGQIADIDYEKSDVSSKPGYNEAVKAWGRFRFVRAGWFTAQEAIDYIEYYYENLSPLTPISPPTFRSPATHLTLLTEEPILTVTLLTIASRYRRMPGTGGHCRSHAIHEQLWTYLRGMIERVVWGQEAFGGGFCGSGADDTQNSSTAPWRGLRRGSLRTLGTIESLLILTEWHPRALHFPPSEATDELMVPVNDSPFGDDSQGPPGNFGGRRIEGWLEPAWRSDRMCWMLLSIGMGLGYELGVFDDIDEMLATNALARPEYEDESYRLRAHRIKRLLLIYLSQLAGRLGWTNMVPENLRKADLGNWKKRPQSVEGTTPGTNPSSISNAFSYIPDLELDDQIIHCWAGISTVMQIGNDKLFKTRKHTTDIIRSEEYIELLKEFQPMIKNWMNYFERLTMPQYIRHILTIEYEYVRIYINSLSLQAVVERSTNNPNVASNVSSAGSAPGLAAHLPQLSPRSQNYLGKVPLAAVGGFGPEDQEYVKEVVEGSRNLLKTVVEGLLPGDFLKHAPVRTYFRIISGAMFLLKTFALGATKTDVEISITLMDRTVEALRNCVVDDVHLGIRFADMLETLTSRLRNRFIHAPPPRAGSVANGRSPAPNHQELANGSGANGQGPNHQPHGPETYAKFKDGVGLERSSTPANISATPWDANVGNFPYPMGSTSVFNPATPAATVNLPDGMANVGGNGPSGSAGDHGLFDNDWANPATEMWYLPPGPAFFQNLDNNSSVTMTAEGVNVGGLDLLEYMAIDTLDQNGFGEGNAF